MTKEALTLAIDVAINAMKDATKSIDKLSAENRTLKEALAQPQRTWVGLTPDDMPDGNNPMFDTDEFALGAAWAQAKLKEKNSA